MTDSVGAHSATAMEIQDNYGSLIGIGAQGSNKGASLLSDSSDSVQQSAEKIGKASSSVIGKVAYDGGFFKKAGRAALISGGAIGIAALAATPAGWVLGAIAGGVFLTYMIAQYVMETKADQNRATPIYGQNGILMRAGLFRVLLKEYAHLLNSMGVNLKDSKGSEELKRAFNFLNNPRSAQNAIEQYEQFVDAHEALILAEKSPEVSEISKKMALARMTPRIQAFQEAFVQEHVGDHDPFTLENFTETFVKRNKTIAASDPQMRVNYWTRQGIKLYGAMSWAHYLKINPPQLRNQEDGVFYLRHATPNKYSPERGVIIDPLYREFLRGADGKVLYAAHQRLNDDGFLENEDVRCQTLVQCENEEKKLLLIFQSVENSLFKNGAETFAALKKQLIDSFYLEEGSRLNRLPKALQQDEDYRKKMEEIFDFIHENFFGKRDSISQEKVDLYGGLPEDKKTTEWQVFIMLFYYYQREDLKASFDVKYVNTGCKDDFDRGGGQNMVSDLMHLFEIYGKDIPGDKLRAIADSVQAPTLQLKGTEPIKYRVHPALCVANLLSSLSDPNQINRIIGRGRVKALTFEKRDGQAQELQRILGSHKG